MRVAILLARITVVLAIGQAVLLGHAMASPSPTGPQCKGDHSFIQRDGWVDVGVPIDPDGDPGSGSFGSAPFGVENELGLIFDVRRPFSIEAASIGLGVHNGVVRLRIAVYDLQAGGTARLSLLASSTADVKSGDGFDLAQRVYGSAGDPSIWLFRWFDMPISFDFAAGKRYELVFSDFTLQSGTPKNGQNWIYGHPLYDDEGRAYAQPYEVCDLLVVADGSLRGDRATLLPMALIRLEATPTPTPLPTSPALGGTGRFAAFPSEPEGASSATLVPILLVAVTLCVLALGAAAALRARK